VVKYRGVLGRIANRHGRVGPFPIMRITVTPNIVSVSPILYHVSI